jgi:hypothetical protein
MSVTKNFLSGSTNGKGIKVVATASAGTTIHTADANDKDEVWLWAINSDSSDRKLTIEFGGTTSPDDLIEYTVPSEDGLHLVIPGLPISGSVVVKAFAASANVVMMHGYVNRIA